MIIQLSVLSLIRLYTVGWWINARVWLWPNQLRASWLHPAKHRDGVPAWQLLKTIELQILTLADREIARGQIRWVGVT